MADPLSITVAVASSVATAGKLLNSINTYRTKFKACDLAALSIKAQCDCILVALGQIQTTLLGKQQLAARLMSDESISGQSLKSVLGACEMTFLVMVDRLATIDRCIHTEPNGSSTREKFSRLWNESEINELGLNISRLSDGLNLLLTALNTKSQLDALELLTSDRASIILERVADDASSILFSGQNESLISRVTSQPPDEEFIPEEVNPKDFSFDQEVLMTPAYLSKVLNQVEERGAGSQKGKDLPEIPTLAPLAMPSESSAVPEELTVYERKPIGALDNVPVQAAISRVSNETMKRTSMQYLNLRQNNLKTFPREICHIKSLKTLHLSLNEIDDIPSNLGNLSNLEFLNVVCNKLTSLPPVLAHMSKLHTVYAHGNPYTIDQLQAWQAQHGAYHPFPNVAQQATLELKRILRDKSILTIPKVADQQENHQLQLGISDQGNSHYQPETSSDRLVEPHHKFLRNFASTSYLKDGRIDMDLYLKTFHS
ncbi:MAG: hypothetical protein Q9216_004204 [Gyalolechia sp. 2 TL-2023]